MSDATGRTFLLYTDAEGAELARVEFIIDASPGSDEDFHQALWETLWEAFNRLGKEIGWTPPPKRVRLRIVKGDLK